MSYIIRHPDGTYFTGAQLNGLDVWVHDRRRAKRFGSRETAAAIAAPHHVIVHLIKRSKPSRPAPSFKVWTSIECCTPSRGEYESVGLPVCSGTFPTEQDADAHVRQLTGHSVFDHCPELVDVTERWVALIVAEATTYVAICPSKHAAQQRIIEWIRAAIAGNDFGSFADEMNGLLDAGQLGIAIGRWEDETPDRVEIHPISPDGTNNDVDPKDRRYVVEGSGEPPASLQEIIDANDGLDEGTQTAIAVLPLGETFVGGGGACAEWRVRRVR